MVNERGVDPVYKEAASDTHMKETNRPTSMPPMVSHLKYKQFKRHQLFIFVVYVIETG